MTALFLLFAGMVLLVGGAAARSLLTPGLPRLRWLFLGLLLLVIGCGQQLFGLAREFDLNATDLLDYLTNVQAGRAMLTMLLGACLLLASELSRFSWLTNVGAAALALWGLAGIGHGATHGDFVRFLHTVHSGAMAVWIGGVWSLRANRQFDAALARRFSPLAGACVLALGVTGVLMSWNHLGSLEALWRSGYGQWLLLKLTVVCAVFAVVALLRTRLTRASSLKSYLSMESVLLVLVLVITSILSVQEPPSHLQLRNFRQGSEQKIHVVDLS